MLFLRGKWLKGFYLKIEKKNSGRVWGNIMILKGDKILLLIFLGIKIISQFLFSPIILTVEGLQLSDIFMTGM